MTGHKSAFAPKKIIMALTQKELSARHYRKRKENSLCPRCPGKKKCSVCLEKDVEQHRKKYMDKPNVRGFRKNNLCYFCGNAIDLPPENICSKCQENFK